MQPDENSPSQPQQQPTTEPQTSMDSVSNNVLPNPEFASSSENVLTESASGSQGSSYAPADADIKSPSVDTPVANSFTPPVTTSPTPITSSDVVAETMPSMQPANAFTPLPAAEVSKKKSKKWLLVVALAVPLIFASAAAAYVGVIVPNKPDNVLKAAVANLFLEDNLIVKGTLAVEPADRTKDTSVTATSIDFDIKNNTKNNQKSAQIKMMMSGINVNADTRYVGESAYLKLSNLATVSTLAEGYVPGISTVLKSVDNQWIEFDKTLLKQAGVACYLENSPRVTEAELKHIAAAYDKAPFFSIKKISSEMVSGQNTKRYELEMDDDKMADFMQAKVASLSSLKKMLDCTKAENKPDFSDLKDGDVTPLTLWIGSDKKIVKIASKSTKQDAEKENLKGSLEAFLTYGEVSVSKPASSKPAMQLLSELQMQPE